MGKLEITWDGDDSSEMAKDLEIGDLFTLYFPSDTGEIVDKQLIYVMVSFNFIDMLLQYVEETDQSDEMLGDKILVLNMNKKQLELLPYDTRVIPLHGHLIISR